MAIKMENSPEVIEIKEEVEDDVSTNEAVYYVQTENNERFAIYLKEDPPAEEESSKCKLSTKSPSKSQTQPWCHTDVLTRSRGTSQNADRLFIRTRAEQAESSSDIKVGDLVCRKCKYSANSKSELKNHIQMAHQSLLCPACKIEYRTFAEKMVHIRRDHSANDLISCPVIDCTRIFCMDQHGYKEYIYHVTKHQEHRRKKDTESRQFLCPICNFVCFTRQDLIEHRKQAHNFRPRKDTSNISPTTSSSTATGQLQPRATRKRVFVATSSTSNSTRCATCGMICATQAHLTHHLINCHKDHFEKRVRRLGPLDCRFVGCIFEAQSQSELREHVKGHREDLEDGSLTRVFKIGETSPLTKCVGCSAMLLQSDRFKHVRENHMTPNGDRFICPIPGCPFPLSSYEIWKNHVLKHTNNVEM